MVRIEENPELRARLKRELARQLFWGGPVYAIFAGLFTLHLELGGAKNATGWVLTAALAVLGTLRTLLSRRVLTAASTQVTGRFGKPLSIVAAIQGFAFCGFMFNAVHFARGQTLMECLMVVGVAGLSGATALLFSPEPTLAWLQVGSQLLPIYIWSIDSIPRWGWVLGALLVIHALFVSQMIQLNGAHLREMFKAQLALEAQSEDLRHARDQAEAASTTRMRFLANMSHEIRTPLNGIIGLAQVLNETPLTQDQRELIEPLRRSGAHLLEILNGILDMAKVTSGKLELERIAFDLPLLIRDVAAPAAALAEAKQMRFVVETQADLPARVEGDPVRIRQVISNLLGNAVKFTAEGEIRIRAAVARAGWVRFDISDTGIGMTSEQAGEVFREFHQVDSSTTRVFGGTGLGLSISQHLVMLMGGRLWVESRLGHGACFSFEIPLLPPGTGAGVVVETDAALALPSGLRILVAEDNRVNRLVIERLLSGTGARVEVAENGREAVERHKDTPFDLILMDCNMPEMDGYEATACIRALPDGRAEVPILAVTADAYPEERERCRRAGMNGHVPKPLYRDALLTAMTQALEGRDAGVA